jgi:phage terminase small subunit
MPRRKAPEPKELTYKTAEELQIEAETGHKLTMRQRKFAEIFVEGERSATQAAIEAGYSPKGAAQRAYVLLDPRESPHVVAYISQLREDIEMRYGVTKEGMLKRLHTLSRKAEDLGQISAAVNSEKIRASLGGLTIDRRETINTVQDLSKDQVITRLEELRQKHPTAFAVIEGQYTEVPDEQGPRGIPLAIDAEIIDERSEPDSA